MAHHVFSEAELAAIEGKDRLAYWTSWRGLSAADARAALAEEEELAASLEAQGFLPGEARFAAAVELGIIPGDTVAVEDPV